MLTILPENRLRVAAEEQLIRRTAHQAVQAVGSDSIFSFVNFGRRAASTQRSKSNITWSQGPFHQELSVLQDHHYIGINATLLDGSNGSATEKGEAFCDILERYTRQ